MIDLPSSINGVDVDELDVIRRLFNVLAAKQPRNMIRSVYFDGKAPLQDLGISLPPQLKSMDAVLGWPALVVRALAHRNIFEGFVSPDQETDPFELDALLEANMFDLELPQAIVSTYKHACSFLTATVGDEESGEPPVVIMARSAEWSAALWDRSRRRVKAALAVTDAKDEQPTEFVVYLDHSVLTCSRRSDGSWVTDRQANPLGRPLVEPLVYDPQLDRPFGRSRISRAIMSLTDRGMRTIARSEVAAEFFATPQRYVLGVDEDAWAGTNKWKAVMGRFLALTKDEDGDVPTVGQFSAQSPQPHTDQLRSIASQVASEANLDLSQLGIVQDNPSSAEAIFAAKEPLIIEAMAANRVFGAALRRLAQTAVMLRGEDDEPSDELRRLQVKWTPPAFPSPLSKAQAMQLEVQSLPWVADTSVALEGFGHDQADITRMMAEKRRLSGVQSLLERIRSETPAASPPSGGE